MNLNALEDRIEEIKRELLSLGEMRPGSLSQQFNTCGSPTCKCKDPENPQKHGPYYQLNYTRKSKSKTEFVSKARLEKVRLQIENYSRFKQLTDEWIDISIEIAQIKRKMEKVKKGK